ncbi:MAG: efflux RND transporter permease subunit [Flavobacteriales bacterium]
MSKRLAIVILCVVALVTAGAGWLASGLRMDYDFEDFFPQDDPATNYYLSFREAFETDNDFFIVALENNQGVFQKDFLVKVDSLSRVLSSLEHAEQVIGPTDLVEVIQDPLFGGYFENEVLRWKEPEFYASDSVRIFSGSGYVGVFFSEDGRSVAIQMKHTKMLSKAKCDVLSYAVEEAVGQFEFDRTHVIGRALGQRVYVEMMIRELIFFISLSLLLTLIFLFVAFRSGWGMVIPALIVLLSLLWTLGFMRLIGKDIDLMLTVLPTIIFVVGVSDSVHVLSKYLGELRAGTPRREAIFKAFRSIRLAMFLTALTTAIGFLTLIFSNIQPISDFGVYTSVGIMMAYGLTYAVLPAILMLAAPRRLDSYAKSEDFWSKYLHSFLRWLLLRRKFVLAGGGLLFGISLVGISMIDVDNKMLEDLRDSHYLKQEFFYFEEHFSGCRPFELGITLPENTNPFDDRIMRQLDILNTYLEETYEVGSMLSPPVIVRSLNMAANAGQRTYYTLPSDSADLRNMKKAVKRRELREIYSLTWDDSTRTVRFAGKVGDYGRQHYAQRNAALDWFIQSACPDLTNYQVTGTAHLIDLNNQYLVDNMLQDLLLSILVIGLMMGIVYKSWRMVPLTILPNVLPILIIAGFMGFAGITLKVSTSIIFNIAYGIAVDDTIHFLARVRSLMLDGYTKTYAVKRAFLSTGKAMIVTTLILSAGFLALVFSDFLGTFYIGLLISLTLFIALIIELLYTPLVVLLFYNNK